MCGEGLLEGLGVVSVVEGGEVDEDEGRELLWLLGTVDLLRNASEEEGK